ncbi:MAG: YcxB family protein [Armatimonadota bacterium]|nr:YcxB family protein [Armatimonadota bacterium]
MKVKYRFEQDDWVAYIEHYYAEYMRQTFIFWTTSISSIIAVLIFLIWLVDKFNIGYFVSLGAIIPLWIIIYPRLQRKRIREFAIQSFDKGKNRLVIGEHNLELTEDYLKACFLGYEAKFDWIIVEKIIENKDYLFIHIFADSAIIVPRNRMENPEQFPALVKLTRQYFDQANAQPQT